MFKKLFLALTLSAFIVAPVKAQTITFPTSNVTNNGYINFTGNETFATSIGAIAKLGSITGGSSYTSGTAILTLGAVTAGSGCTTPGAYAVTFSDSTTPAATGATGTVFVNGGAWVKVTLNANGGNSAGYLVNDTLTATVAGCTGSSVVVGTTGAIYSLPFTGGLGTGATGSFQVISTGTAVSAVTLVNPGINYTTSDTLSANVPGGSGFSIPVTLVGQASGPSTGGGLWFNGTSGISASGVCSNTGTCFQSLYTINDSVDASAAGNAMFNFEWNVNYGGGKGGRQAGTFVLNFNSAPLDSNSNFTAFGTVAQASVNDGGTTGAGNGKGDLFGADAYCRLVSGATFWSQCIGEEIDMSIRYGASADQAIGLQIVQDSQFNVAPNQIGIGYSINNASGAIGWDIGFADGAYAGNPSLKTTGTLLGCEPHAGAGNCGTIGSGIDLNNYSTISNFVLRGPQANGNIDGGFNVHAVTVSVTGNASITNGIGQSGNVLQLWANSTQIADVVNTNNGLLGINVAAAINTGDQLATLGSNNGVRSATFKNSNASAGAQEVLYLANNTSNTEFSITLNGSATVTGNGANSVTINGAAGLWFQGNGTNAIVITSAGVPQLPSVATGTPAASLCIDASNNIIKKTTTGSCI